MLAQTITAKINLKIKTHPNFYDSSVNNLSDGVKIMGKAKLNNNLKEEEVNSTISFLETLLAYIPQETNKIPSELVFK